VTAELIVVHLIFYFPKNVGIDPRILERRSHINLHVSELESEMKEIESQCHTS